MGNDAEIAGRGIVHVLLLDDERNDAELIKEKLLDYNPGIVVDWAANEKEFKNYLKTGDYQLILADFQLRGFDAPAALRLAQTAKPDTPFICITGAVGEEKAVEFLKSGGTDFVLKDRIDKLPLAVIRALDEVKERRARHQAETALRESEDRYRKLVESSVDAIFVCHGDTIVYINPAGLKLLRATGAIPGQNLGNFIPLWVLERLENETSADKTAISESELCRCDQTNVPVEITVAQSHFEGKISRLIVARDISERKRAEEQIRYLAQHDSLTGLPNRALLSDRISQTIALCAATGSGFALLFLDVDFFKKINDSLGHYFGDLFLHAAAKVLIECTTSTDTVCRQGGDEFIILVPKLAHAGDAASVAQKICAAFAQPLKIERHSVRTSVSIGIALYPSDGGTQAEIIRNADIAMYHAKESGRNQFQFFSEELNQITHQRLAMESALREAIDRKQFTVHYQPQLNLRTGKIESAEALLRWDHPELGKVMPARFIPIAEETGVIGEIGEWVLNEVSQRYHDFRSAGITGMRVAVNVSAMQMIHSDFSALVADTLRGASAPFQYLELEVTETMLMRDIGKSTQTIESLSRLGVRFSIDDFGTGYSSLSYLRQLNIHSLKIDQSFVREMTHHSDDATIVRSIIGLGQNLRLNVIAEGVETQEQLEFLKNHGCDFIQGFFLAKPMPIGNLLDFLAGI